MPDRFSIALATCNGARYLPALLESLAAQQLPPCEIVASDDASDDESCEMLAAFAECASFPVRVLRNPERLGVAGNFSRAIAHCGGAYIALADQDDVWRPEKLMRLARALALPGCTAVFSDAEIVDESLTTLGYTMWQRVHFTNREQTRFSKGESFSILLKHSVVTGATLAFKNELRDSVLPIPSAWPHDTWIALVASANEGLAAVAEPLIDYRQHANNTVGGLRKSFLREARSALTLNRAAWYRRELDLWHSLYARLQDLPAPAYARAELAEKLAHLETRSRLPAARWRRLPGVLSEVASGRYTRYARNWGSTAIDLLVR